MTYNDLLHQLQRHAGLAPEIANDGTSGTVVGMLRPFKHFDRSLLKAALGVATKLAKAPLDTSERLRAALFMIELATVTRSWALDPDSMLARNHLLDEELQLELLEWVRGIEELAKEVLVAAGHDLR